VALQRRRRTARTNEGIAKLLGDLESDLVLIDQELGTARRTLSPDAPQFGLLEARRHAIRENITALKARLTTVAGPDKDTLSAIMTRYDTLDLERQIAERQYTAAATALEQARVAAERQGMYLATFVKPVRAQESDWPHRFWMPLAAALAFCLIWLVIVSAFELMRHLKA
jgi:capsular polysaccharide transport system permease protein